MITSKDLAKLAGVSQITVSRALNDSPLVKEETKKMILQYAKENNYELNSFAQSLRTKKTGAIGLLLPTHFVHTSQNLYSTSLFSFLQAELETTGYDIIPTTDRYNEGTYSHVENMLARKKIDGLIVNRDEVSDKVFDLLESNNIPCVFIPQTHSDTRIKYSVSLDQYQSGYIAGEHLAKKGFSQVIMVLGPEGSSAPRERQKGITDAFHAYDIELCPSCIFRGDYSYESGYRLTSDNIECFRESQAVYYQSDATAIGGIKALREHDIDLEKLDIVSGDGTPITAWYSPSLTTVQAPSRRIAKEVTGLMQKLLQNKEAVRDSVYLIIQPSLVIGESSK